MNKKQSSHFVNLPKINMSRSRFNMDFGNKTSFNAGQLIPMCTAIEVLPGDTFNWSTRSFVRLSTLLAPIMDDLYLDTYFFYVPYRLLWDHYVNFLGENDTSPWVSQTTYSVPQTTAPQGGWNIGTLADYFAIPTGVELSVSSYAFRAYCKIVRDWFYDENIQTPCDFKTDDATQAGSNGNNYVTDLIKGGVPFNICKMHDVFTSVLPSPQKGDSVKLPLGNIDLTSVPVGVGDVHSMSLDSDGKPISEKGVLFNANGEIQSGFNHPIGVQANTSAIDGSYNIGSVTYNGATIANPMYYQPTNLYANGISSADTNITINDLRLAFQTQRLLERMARGGTRYYEILASQWGITPPQGVVQRSEYLGGHRHRLNVNSVVQTSESTQDSPQGTLTAYSITVDRHHDFIKSFYEGGLIIGLCAVRYFHSYQQGLPKQFSRKDLFDYYNHAFAYIGEQAIYNKEIYAQGTSVDDEVFGYNEAWVQYRYNNNTITGQLRSASNSGFDVWHLGDDYSQLPTFSEDWIQEDKTNVDRVVTVTSAVANQFIADFWFEVEATRPMPLYSIPGLIDHM